MYASSDGASRFEPGVFTGSDGMINRYYFMDGAGFDGGGDDGGGGCGCGCAILAVLLLAVFVICVLLGNCAG